MILKAEAIDLAFYVNKGSIFVDGYNSGTTRMKKKQRILDTQWLVLQNL